MTMAEAKRRRTLLWLSNAIIGKATRRRREMDPFPNTTVFSDLERQINSNTAVHGLRNINTAISTRNLHKACSASCSMDVGGCHGRRGDRKASGVSCVRRRWKMKKGQDVAQVFASLEVERVCTGFVVCWFYDNINLIPATLLR